VLPRRRRVLPLPPLPAAPDPGRHAPRPRRRLGDGLHPLRSGPPLDLPRQGPRPAGQQAR
ncbi:hypothetical protein BN1708_019790, partial [Verticillium longisporum]